MDLTQEKLNSWYEHKSNKEKTIEAEENEVCPICEGEGMVADFSFDSDSKQYVRDTDKLCVCQLVEN